MTSPLLRCLPYSLCAVLLLVGTSCQTSKVSKKDPAAASARAEFLDEVWLAPKFKKRAVSDYYTSVVVAPVNTAHLQRSASWWKQQSGKTQASVRRDVERIAISMRKDFRDSLDSHPHERLELVDKAGPKTLVVELALVELTPSKVYWNTAATAAGFVAPGASLLMAAGRGTIAMEGKIKDGKTGKVIGTFKDKESDKFAPINLRNYAWYGGADRTINEWAKQFAELLNSPAGTVIKDSSPVTLMPW